jgi:predicted transcriptional regulator of viral defense system
MATGAADKQIEAARRIFRHGGGILRTGEALDQGIHPRTLYAMRDTGILERLDRGLYRLTDLPPLSDPDLVTVANRIPKGVICHRMPYRSR